VGGAGWSRGRCRLVTWGVQAGHVGVQAGHVSGAGWSSGGCRLINLRVEAGHVGSVTGGGGGVQAEECRLVTSRVELVKWGRQAMVTRTWWAWHIGTKERSSRE
jgi:hypothetical protein